MKPEIARGLAIRISQIAERWDHWGYADTLADYDNNEELLLEQSVKDLTEEPEVVISYLLETMECMLDGLDM